MCIFLTCAWMEWTVKRWSPQYLVANGKEDQRVEQRELALRCIMESMCIAMYITKLSNKMQRRDNAPQLFGLNLEPQ
ncbi:hypothetical protein SORBI_3007G048101 [Sorghum bicolor]|uniref:Uncharacterized protein n=1 Tax=Sorghum bicolor TaxID=4558 RepID=A0A1Z5R8N0_SORBI|nr:hypothetical protein SORBI_3007G048101 [Sorghum bicolor]